MKMKAAHLLVCISLIWLPLLGEGRSDEIRRPARETQMAPEAIRSMGRLADPRLVECSGLGISSANADLLWAINDGGHGPYIHALGMDGRHRGRLRVEGAENRDWEDLAMFTYLGRRMILIADIGDNHQQYDRHTIYVVEEPVLTDRRFKQGRLARVAWKFSFVYPHGRHDAEAVAVDRFGKQVLVMTKRDRPPLLFALPLKPADGKTLQMARKVAAVTRIPPPTAGDLAFEFGTIFSQPTAMDLSSDGRLAVVLTYKDAYLFRRKPEQSWAAALGGLPELISLPHPRSGDGLRQREAVGFTPDRRSLLVTSEGKSAAIYRVTFQ